MKLAELVEGATGTAVFWIKQKSSGITSAGKEYYNLEVADCTKELQAKVWDVAGLSQVCVTGAFISASYTVQVYKEALQLTLRNIQVAAEGSYDKADFFKTTPYSIHSLYNKLCRYIEQVENSVYRKVLEETFRDGSEVMRVFLEHPAAVTAHHSFIGGLLHHTVSVAHNAALLAKAYSCDYDLCVTAALLHDVGKVWEMTGYPSVQFTKFGAGVGHIVLGASYATELCKKLGGSEDEVLRLQHCILAHHGQLEWGSPVVPACPEALIVHHADALDAKMEVMREVYESDDSDAEITGKNWVLRTSLLK